MVTVNYILNRGQNQSTQSCKEGMCFTLTTADFFCLSFTRSWLYTSEEVRNAVSYLSLTDDFQFWSSSSGWTKCTLLETTLYTHHNKHLTTGLSQGALNIPPNTSRWQSKSGSNACCPWFTEKEVSLKKKSCFA